MQTLPHTLRRTRSERARLTDDGPRSGIRVLRWLAIGLPVLFLLVADVLRHTVLAVLLHSLAGFVAVYGLAVAGIVAFSLVLFDQIERLQRRVTEKNRQLAALNSLAIAATEELYLDDLLTTGLDHALAAMQADAGIVCLVDLERQEHSAICHRGFSQDLVGRIQRAKLQDDPVAAEVVRTGRPVVLERVFEDPRVAEAARREGIRSAISTPLKSDGEVNGILAIATRQERHFSEADQDYLAGIGGQLGMAIRKAVLYEEAQRRNRELTALLAVGRAVTSSLDLDEVLGQSLDTVVAVTSADAAEVWVTDGDTELVMRAHRGSDPAAFLERRRFRLGEGLPGIAALSRDCIVVHDLPSDPRFVRQHVVQAGFKTLVALPLQYQRALVGVLVAAARSPEAMRSSGELRLLDGIGERIAAAIENARLHRQVQDAAVLQERERIAREMHDSLGQVLGYVNTQTLAAKKLLADGRRDEAVEELAKMQDVARDLYDDVREGILGLRTTTQREGGLLGALRDYIDRYGELSGLDARLVAPDGADRLRLSPPAEIQLVRVIQEALSNVRKHARASTVLVTVERDEDCLRLTVADDGQGFDPDRLHATGWPRFGLQTMRERAESVGGTFAVETGSGLGTRVVVSVPFEPARPGQG